MSNLPLDYIQDPDIQRNFQKLAGLFPDFGGRTPSVRFGSANITFTASSISATTLVAHGLGKVPVYVCSFSKTSGLVPYEAAAPDATNISLAARHIDGTVITLTNSYYWLAIG